MLDFFLRRDIIIGMEHLKNRRLTSAQTIILGYAAAILLGSILLSLPIATRSRESTPFLDALFTSTSAVCVTGLIVRDTATYFSLFGKLTIITLIQAGGVGVVTLAVTFAVAAGKKLRLSGQNTMLESVSAEEGKGAWRYARFILLFSLAVETIGALLLMPAFCSRFGARGLWYAVFHSVSAYCNAGFDLMGAETGRFSSLTAFVGSPLVNFTICGLILSGGLGFSVWGDIGRNKFRLKKYSVQSKAVLLFGALLVFIPSLYFYFAEFSSAAWKAELSGGERALASFFQTVTPRTAGFNTVDYLKMSEASLLVTIALMLIGGASGSTAGGMKITTMAVLFCAAIAAVRKRREVRCFGRRISSDTVKDAATIAFLYITLFFAGSVAISSIEKLPVVDCMFETASAIATVGLSTGITAGLSAASHIILIALMYFGRVGGLTLFTAVAFGGRSGDDGSLPLGTIAVG